MTTQTELAPAKLNLALHVRSRRADGYHELETLFAFVKDGDLLTAGQGADGLHLTIDGPMAAGLAAGDDNLVIRAANALALAAGVPAVAALRLTKNLPVASGIGGGSADAAAALRLLNRLWDLHWPRARLAQVGAPLGADVPACVHVRALMGSGRGERLVPVSLGGMAGAPVLLVNPMKPVMTGPVFKAWDGVDHGPLAAEISVAALHNARNDLQAGATRLCPDIADVIAVLGRQPGVRLARMSGSGATCFALFDDDVLRDAALAVVQAEQSGWWAMATALRAD